MSRQPITAMEFATRLADDARRFGVGWERARGAVSGFAQKQSFAEWMKHFSVFVEKDDAKRTARSNDSTLVRTRKK